MEIRIHGRGGQGGVTCAKILATLYARQGNHVQTFGDYAGERSGAPVRAYTRVAEAPITNRNKVYEPDHLVVLDSSLLDGQAVAGLAPGGFLVVATREGAEQLAARFPGQRVAVVDATDIARRHGIGSRTVTIVNTTMAGAFARALGLSWGLLEDTYRELGFAADLPAAREAWEQVSLAAARPVAAPAPPRRAAPAPLPPVLDLVEHTAGAAPALRTGSWRSQLPRYVRRLAPCNAACPAGNDVEGFVQALARDGEAAAAAILARTTPLAATCGRVCPGFCMLQCNRRELDGAVDVRALERWVADHVTVARGGPETASSPRQVAVVGGGPAGLAAAYELRRSGHLPTVFDQGSELGGVLRTGIPGYRLPRGVLEREVAALLALGVEARCDTRVSPGHLAALAGGFDAVVLATGLQSLRDLGVPGAELPGIEQGIGFLKRVNAGLGAPLPRRVVVLGGGNTAVDCARTALRCGATRVTIVYRRSRAEMPAIAEEIEQALEEGVRLVLQRAPVAFHGEHRVAAVELAEVTLGAPDADGRRRPVLGEGRQQMACDLVLLALGQQVDPRVLPAAWELRDGQVWEGEDPLPVFAAGDLATGEGTVAHAIGDGRRAAQRALGALGDPCTPWIRPDAAIALPPSEVRFSHFARSRPAAAWHRAAAARTRDFREVALGLGDPREARRCFSCGDCNLCDTCLAVCPDGVIHRNGTGYAIDLDYCKGCGLCVAECPRGGMELAAP